MGVEYCSFTVLSIYLNLTNFAFLLSIIVSFTIEYLELYTLILDLKSFSINIKSAKIIGNDC